MNAEEIYLSVAALAGLLLPAPCLFAAWLLRSRVEFVTRRTSIMTTASLYVLSAGFAGWFLSVYCFYFAPRRLRLVHGKGWPALVTTILSLLAILAAILGAKRVRRFTILSAVGMILYASSIG